MKTKKLPALPKTVPSQLGNVPVLLVPDLKTDKGENALGLWVPEERAIKLREGLHPTTAWATLLHEAIHCWLWDSGSGDMPDIIEEHVCDALSSALLYALLIDGGLLPRR